MHSAREASSDFSSGCRRSLQRRLPRCGYRVGHELRHGAADGASWHGGGDGGDDSGKQGSLPPGTGDEAPASAPAALPSTLTCLVPYPKNPSLSGFNAALMFQPFELGKRTSNSQTYTNNPAVGAREHQRSLSTKRYVTGHGQPAPGRTVPAAAIVGRAGSARTELVRTHSRYNGNFPQ